MLHPNLIPIAPLHSLPKYSQNLCKAAACTLPRSSSSQHIIPVHKQLYRIILLLPFTSAHSAAPLYHTDLRDPFTPSCTLRASSASALSTFPARMSIMGLRASPNSLPLGIWTLTTVFTFKLLLKEHQFRLAFPSNTSTTECISLYAFTFFLMLCCTFKICFPLKFAWWPWEHWKMHLVKSEITSQNKLFSNLNLSLFFYSVIIKMVYRCFPEIRAWPQTVTKNSPFTRPKSDKKKFPVFVEFVTAV